MDQKTLLGVLSPQLQALVEASLGEKLQIRKVSTSALTAPPSVEGDAGAGVATATANATETTTGCNEPGNFSPAPVSPGPAQQPIVTPAKSVKLNPAELFVLRHPESPGYVVKNDFLGRSDALRVRDALVALSQNATFHHAAVGHGDNKRQELAVRGDRIHWIQRPKDLLKATSLDASILLLMRKVESVVFGIKNALPGLDLRNVTSTQLAIFPGDGARFVKHTDTYSTAHLAGRSDGGASSDSLVRLITCVYYLNPDWTTSHGGCLRVFTKGDTTAGHWDVPPSLDTLVVFRSTDVEHEVLPTFRERMALTIWYYGHAAPQQPQPQPSIPPPATVSTITTTTTTTIDPAHATPPPSADSIFVAIPSYRDSECRHTVDDLFRQASDPSRISVGICLQSDDDDDTQQYLESKYTHAQVRIHRVHYRDAAGPCVARAIAQSLWQQETYYLQIDSHMRFRHAWDTLLIDELRQCASSPKPILTTYPLGYTLPNELSTDTRPTLLCASHFDDHGMLRQSSKTLARHAQAPIASLFWAAGFAFCSAEVIRQVPYDASLRFLFFGEEASMSARLFTHGWDFYAPREMVVYHLWTRAYRPVFQELESETTKTQRLRSIAVVTSQLQLQLQSDGSGDGAYGLGTQRTMEEYQRHLGVDFASRTIEWRAEWGNLDPIQFDLLTSVAK